MFDVIGFGENSIDDLYRLPAWPHPDTGTAKLRIDGRSRAAGGQVATTMGACATLGLRAKYIGAFGDDAGARVVREALTDLGVDIGDAFVRPAPNRHALILVDQRGERAVLWERDPRLTIRPEEVNPEWLSGVRALHVDGVDEEAAIVLAGLARAAGLHVTSDIEHVGDRTDALVAAVTVPILAEHATATLTGESDPERALRRLRRRHDGWLCVTLGEHGAMLLEGDVVHHEPAYVVDAVDTTGAGDIFRAGFLYGLLRGLAAPEVLRLANAAAAVSCTREGALDGAPTFEDVSALMLGRA